MRPARAFRRLPLFWKLLVPYVGLLVIVGAAGAFLITRDLTARAQTTLNEQLLQSSLKARALLQERELYLLESANLAANLEGMAEAIRARDTRAVTHLLGSVLALKDDLNVLAVTERNGTALVRYARERPSDRPRRTGPAGRLGPLIARALAEPAGSKVAGIAPGPGGGILAIAAAVCSRAAPCDPVGAAVVGLRLDRLAETAAGRPGKGARAALRIFDPSGMVIASTGTVPAAPAPIRIEGDTSVRRTERIGDADAQTLYAPYEVQGRRVGMIGVSLPSAPAFASVRGAAIRLVGILLAALAGVIAVGALLSRVIVGQTRTLLQTNRALGRGDLSARAPVVSDDEIGELARGLNQMAEQLQASYETLESRVDQRTEEVQRLLRERTEFFASLSHELRTPIALLISHGEMLLDPDFRDSPRTLSQRGVVIRDTGKQLLAVVNDILDLARLEAGSVRVEIVETSVRNVLDELRPTIEGLTSAADLSVWIEPAGELLRVQADPRRFREILLNLIDNAVKYTPPGGRVTIGVSADDAEVAIAVADTGIGIPSEARAHIFEPFFRVADTATQRGQFSTGLGLAIAERLAAAQAGRITVESDPGAGSTFTLHLPRAGGTVRALSPRSADTPGRRAPGDGRRGRARGRVS